MRSLFIVGFCVMVSASAAPFILRAAGEPYSLRVVMASLFFGVVLQVGAAYFNKRETDAREAAERIVFLKKVNDFRSVS